MESFVEVINRHRCAVVSHLETICVDESISRWYGLGGDWYEIILPHYLKLDRKTESGYELRTSYCANCGIMLKLELMKLAVDSDARDYEKDMQHETANILRFVES